MKRRFNALRSMKHGASVTSFASRGEIDERFMASVERRRVRGARAISPDEDQLPEHRRLVFAFPDSVAADGVKRITVRNRGQPLFDGVRDKDPMLVDMYMAGLVSCLAVATKLLSVEGGETKPVMISLPRAMQLSVLDAIEVSHRVSFPEVRRAIEALAEIP